MHSIRTLFLLMLAMTAFISTSFATNIDVPVFGDNLFTGKFSEVTVATYNPDYIIKNGDRIAVDFYGALETSHEYTVDEQGNIFIPNIGPVKMIGLKNSEIMPVVADASKRVYRDSVSVYANLISTQRIQLYLTGHVVNPGLYGGLSTESILSYIDRAGGVDLEHGSMIDIQVIRGGTKVVYNMNLYDFMLTGELRDIQFRDSDVIRIGPLGRHITVVGDAGRAYQFEIEDDSVSGEYMVQLAQPKPSATHVKITRNTDNNTTVKIYETIDAVKKRKIQHGDVVEFVSDRQDEMVGIKVSGEFDGNMHFTLPKGATVDKLIEQIKFTDNSYAQGIHIYRKSVAKRQKEFLLKSLQELEALALEQSSTKEEAAIRATEAKTISEFVEKAKNTEPKGQVILSEADLSTITLEDGDHIVIPSKDKTVLVQGEVMIPSTFAHIKGSKVSDYIEWSGGFTRIADERRVLIRRGDGRVEACAPSSFLGTSPKLEGGEEILVLPEVNSKNVQLSQTIADIIYKVAVATSVVISL